jgi:Methyltransferase domain
VPIVRTYVPSIEGIPILLTGAHERRDLWDEGESSLARALRDDPALERALLDPPAGELAPADAMLRALVLEERGNGGARDEAHAAYERLYTPETLACRERVVSALVDELRDEAGLVVDLATGRGFLLERLAAAVPGPVVATDLSPWAARRVRAALGVDAVMLDARQMPFADGAVPTVTTFLGLATWTIPSWSCASFVASREAASSPSAPSTPRETRTPKRSRRPGSARRSTDVCSSTRSPKPGSRRAF